MYINYSNKDRVSEVSFIKFILDLSITLCQTSGILFAILNAPCILIHEYLYIFCIYVYVFYMYLYIFVCMYVSDSLIICHIYIVQKHYSKKSLI